MGWDEFKKDGIATSQPIKNVSQSPWDTFKYKEFATVSDKREDNRYQESADLIEKVTTKEPTSFLGGAKDFFTKYTTPWKFVKDVVKGKEETVAKGAVKFSKRAGTTFVSMGADAVNFFSDYIGRQPEKAGEIFKTLVTPGITSKIKGLADIKKSKPSPAFKEWTNAYKDLEEKGVLPQEKIKALTDNLLERDYMANSPEWNEASTMKKMTTMLPETLYNIGPSIVASIGWYAINPALGAGVMAGSTAEDVSQSAVEYGVDENKAQDLGLITGFLISALDRIVPSRALSGDAKKKFLGSFVKKLIKSGTLESGTEVTQEGIQMIAESTFRDLKLSEMVERVAMAGLGGVFGGSGMQLIGNFKSALGSKGITDSDIKKLKEIPTEPKFKTVAESAAEPEIAELEATMPRAIEPVAEPVTKPIEVAKAKPVKEVVKPIKVAKVEAISKELEPLAKEARKYKSAEEFVEAQGKPMFHGTATEFDEFDISKAGTLKTSDWGSVGVYFDPQKSGANYYRKQAVVATDKKANKLYETYENKAKELGTKPMYEGLDLGVDSKKYKELKVYYDKWIDYRKALREDTSTGKIIEAYLEPDAKVYKYVHEGGTPDNYLADMKMEEGYDAVEIWFRESADSEELLEEIIVMKPSKIKTKSQLTDIYNQATKEVVKKEVKEAKEVEVKEKAKTGIAKTIEAEAIKQDLTKGFEEVAEYTPTVIKEQSEIISDLIENDIEKAKRMVTGEEDLGNIKGALLVATMTNWAMEQKDGALLAEIANSPLATEISEAGQTLRLVQEMYKDSAFTKIQEIKKEREKAVERALKKKTKKQLTDSIKRDMKEKVAKAKPIKKDWASLVDEITC